jgi:hypothetical protein
MQVLEQTKQQYARAADSSAKGGAAQMMIATGYDVSQRGVRRRVRPEGTQLVRRQKSARRTNA